MAKKQKIKNKQGRPKAALPEKSGSKVIEFTQKYPSFVPLVILFTLLLIFFYDVLFGGKTFLPPDGINSKSIKPFLTGEFSRGVYPLWDPYIFSGMPSFASLKSAPFVDLIGNVFHGVYWIFEKIFPVDSFFRAMMNYFMLGAFMYLLMMRKIGVRGVALFTAIAIVFQPPIIAFIAHGHGSKLTTAAMLPLIFFVLDEFLESRRIRYFALLALAVGLQLLRAHTQIAYYAFMMIGLYVVFWSIFAKKNNTANTSEIVKSVGATVLALVIGIAISSWLYISVLEYAEYSIRGGGAGLDYGYATNWSFAPKEMMTFLIPSFFGFGGASYWGEMLFTDFPLYMGVIPLLLAGAALLIRRDKYIIFFAILSIVTLLISFGKHFPFFYDILFNFLPFFNKFRVPSMILILLQFSVVVLSGFGLHAVMQLEQETVIAKLKKYIYIFAGICVGLALFILAAKSTYLGWAANTVKQLQPQAQLAAYESTAIDSLKMAFFAVVSGVLIIFFLNRKIRPNMFVAAMVLVLLADLWSVDFKITDPQPKANEQRYFAATPAVRYLKEQDDVYRIYQVADDKPANWYGYHKIQNISGYHAAKLKIYQTFIEKTGLDARNRYGLNGFLAKYYNVVMQDGRPSLQPTPPTKIPEALLNKDNAMLDMLNVKYLVSFYPIPGEDEYKLVQSERPFVYENMNMPGRAYFVEKVHKIENENQFYNELLSGNFNPAYEAYLFEDAPYEISSSGNNKVSITSYQSREITLSADVIEPALMVLSEIYYPAGWKAYVDGVETKIYRTNAILRSIFLQPGRHEVKFEFSPNSFYVGLWISISMFTLMLGLLVYDLKFRKQFSAEKQN